MSNLIGGALIGLASALLLLRNGRILGASGIAGRLLDGESWRFAFIAGLLLGGAGFALFRPQVFGAPHWASPAVLAVAGVLVGVGTQLANGCTSGHGISGIGRGSKRSIVATGVFMAVGIATATWVH